jgi:hypothetical protein
MNRKRLRQLSGQRVRLYPPPISLDARGVRTPRREDEWLVERASSESLCLRNIATDHFVEIGRDGVHSFTSTPCDGDGVVGSLTLLLQLTLQGPDVRITLRSPQSGRPIYVPVRRRPRGEVVLPIAGTANKTAELIVLIGLAALILAALEHWPST